MSRFGKFLYQELTLFMAGLSALQERDDIGIGIGILKLKGELYQEFCERKNLEQSIKHDTLKINTNES